MCPHRVSIIIPIYNVGKWLSKCLNSCINQTYENIEIIVVNDGSTDDSKNIVQRFQRKDTRIHLINQTNQGPNKARKTGINQSTGGYAMFLDGDDYLELNAVTELVTIARNTEADIVLGGTNVVWSKDFMVIDQIVFDYSVLKGFDYLRKVLTSGPTSVWAKLYKADIIKSRRIEFSNYRVGEDFLLTAQWGLLTQRVVTTSLIFYNYVVSRPGSVMSGDRRIYVEGAFDSYFALFNILANSSLMSEYEPELVNRTAAQLYTFLYHPDNRRSSKTDQIKVLNNFIFQRRKMLGNRQFKMMAHLLKISTPITHWFVFVMQRLKPTINPSIK